MPTGERKKLKNKSVSTPQSELIFDLGSEEYDFYINKGYLVPRPLGRSTKLCIIREL